MEAHYFESADPWLMFVGIVIVAIVAGLPYGAYRYFKVLFQQHGRAGVGISITAREEALDILERNNLQAHYYLPAVTVQDKELAQACRFLASSGYIITDAQGAILGKVATARPTEEELIAERRASFKIIKQPEKDGV